MEIISNKLECIKLAKLYYEKNEHEVLSSWNIKEQINNSFSPDSFLFFKSKEDLIPLVMKNDVVYFFGGNTPFNDYNVLTSNSSLLNSCIDYLKNNKLKFRLTSIKPDIYNSLNTCNKKFDVPFNQNWIIKNIGNFNIESFLKNQRKKKRDKIKRSKKILHYSKFVNVCNDEYKEKYLYRIYDLHNLSFETRGKSSCWKKYKKLYCNIFNIFLSKKFSNVNRILIDERDKIIASYNLILNKNEVYLAFSNCYDFSIPNLQFLLYLDILEQSKILACNTMKNVQLNAARGNFSYKSRMGFKPEHMFAIVCDSHWNISVNNDITKEATKKLYGREFGCFL